MGWGPGHHFIRILCIESWTSSLAGGKKLGIEKYWLSTMKDNPSFTIRVPVLGHLKLQRDPEIEGEEGDDQEASGGTIP